jgi:uncharacterized protein
LDALILVLLGLVGVLAGAASGLFGVGGGILVVPGLILLARLSFTHAVAASLLFIVFTSPLGVWRHWKHHNVDFRQGGILGLTGVAGVLLGELIQRHTTEKQLILAFCVLLVWAAQHLVYGKLPERSRPSLWLLGMVGVFAGVVAKLFGIGGGIVVVPALVFIGLPVHRAVGTSLVSVFLNALVATGINLSQDTSWAVWAVSPALGALVGVQWGVRTGVRMHATALKQAFAILILLVTFDLMRRAF